VAAVAAMGQLRAVLTELLAAEDDLGHVLRRIDAFAARMPSLRAATLALMVLDPGHGDTALHHLRASPAAGYRLGREGRGGTWRGPGRGRSAPARRRCWRAARSPRASWSCCTATAWSSGRTGPSPRAWTNSPWSRPTQPRTGRSTGTWPRRERVCQLTVELLTRTGHTDDITVLAAQWLAEPVPPLHLSLPSVRPSLTTARDAFAGWLSRLDAAVEDADALHLAMVEVFTNAIEHAYPRDAPGTVELDASLESDGSVACLVTDHGTWLPPDPADGDRGHGLMVAGQVVDKLLVSHPVPRGTTVTLRHRLRRPAVLAAGHLGEHVASADGPPFTVDVSVAAGGRARALVGARWTPPPRTCWPGGCSRSAGAARSRWSPT